MDTALRLSDKVVPMLHAELGRRTDGSVESPRRLKREIWMLTPNLYVVNARPDLMANVAVAIAQGFRDLSPAPPWTA